jgi:hypothetical protein
MTKKKWFWILLSIGAILVLTVSQTLAKGGSGGEPGSGCTDQSINYKYAPAPYLGQVYASYEGGNVYITGSVEQAGNSGCTGGMTYILFMTSIGLAEFQALTSKDLQGVCLAGFSGFFTPTCVLYDAFEIVGAGGLKFTSDTSFTFNAVIMQLVPK